MRDALRSLTVDRLNHGVRCEDPDLVAELRDRQVPLNVCPLLNCCLRVFPVMTSHNIRHLHKLGLGVTVNSDDPSYFGDYVNDN